MAQNGLPEMNENATRYAEIPFFRASRGRMRA